MNSVSVEVSKATWMMLSGINILLYLLWISCTNTLVSNCVVVYFWSLNWFNSSSIGKCDLLFSDWSPFEVCTPPEFRFHSMFFSYTLFFCQIVFCSWVSGLVSLLFSNTLKSFINALALSWKDILSEFSMMYLTLKCKGNRFMICSTVLILRISNLSY